MAIRVLLVDDDAMVRMGLSMILQSSDEFQVVGEAADGDEVVRVAQQTLPDVILLDLGMQRVNGLNAIGLLRKAGIKSKILVLTTWDGSDDVMRALDAGAAGYLLKISSQEQIKDAVRSVHAGDAVLSPRTTRQLLDRFASNSHGAERRAAQQLIGQLTERELQVAREIAKGGSNEDVARALFVSVATVKTHLASIQQKLDVDGRVQIAVLVERAGLNRG